MDRSVLAAELAELTSGYRRNEIQPIGAAHVTRWVEQFDDSVQEVILREMLHIFREHYWSSARVTATLRRFFHSADVWGSRPDQQLASTTPLNIQQRGTSQQSLLALASDILVSDFGLPLSRCSGDTNYLYIDDCVFTGNRLVRDIQAWAPTAPQNAHLTVFLLGCHIGNWSYVREQVHKALQPKAIHVRFFYGVVLDNRRFRGSNGHYLWPQAIVEDEQITNYCQHLSEQTPEVSIFRTFDFAHDNLFSSSQARSVVERIFLRVGVRLVLAAQNPHHSMKPMGYQYLPSLGFGSIFVTYRNISTDLRMGY